MSGIAGLRGTGDWGTDERPKDFRESILFYNPNGTAPIFALTGKAGKKTVTDPQFFWWSEPNTLWHTTVNGALLSSDTTMTINTSDPTNTTPGALWSTATQRTPDSPRAWHGLAYARRVGGDLPGSWQALDRALELRPGYVPAHVSRVYLLLARGDVAAAREEMEVVEALGGARARGVDKARVCSQLQGAQARACIAAGR